MLFHNWGLKSILVNIPKASNIETEAFKKCSNLTEVSLPSATRILQGTFNYCTNLKKISFRVLNEIYGEVFNACPNLKTIDLGTVYTIKSYGLFGATTLESVILRNTLKVCSLENVNAFQGTPFASGGTGGTVYVPQALIESYKTETNWSSLYTGGTVTFAPIEGSEFE